MVFEVDRVGIQRCDSRISISTFNPCLSRTRPNARREFDSGAYELRSEVVRFEIASE
jgi:hypothetical protein